MNSLQIYPINLSVNNTLRFQPVLGQKSRGVTPKIETVKNDACCREGGTADGKESGRMALRIVADDGGGAIAGVYSHRQAV